MPPDHLPLMEGACVMGFLGSFYLCGMLAV
jgi:hypothetical protein